MLNNILLFCNGGGGAGGKGGGMSLPVYYSVAKEKSINSIIKEDEQDLELSNLKEEYDWLQKQIENPNIKGEEYEKIENRYSEIEVQREELRDTLEQKYLNKITPYQAKFANEVDSETKADLKPYLGNDYARINDGLRKPDKVIHTTSEKQVIAAMDSAFAQASPLGEKMVLYRGISENVANKLVKGAEFTDKGYMSTSISVNIAHNFSDMRNKLDGIVDNKNQSKVVNIMRVHTNKSTKGIAPSNQTKYTQEHEIILNRNTTVTVKKITTKGKYKFFDVEVK